MEETNLLTPLSYMQVLHQQIKGWQFGMVILNQPLLEIETIKKLWPSAVLSVLVDGGTNRFYDAVAEIERMSFLPNLISGDFDSIREDVREFYEGKGVKVKATPDQDWNDFAKALKLMMADPRSAQLDAVLVFGAYGGRMDQVFANIDVLHQASQLGCPPVILVEASQMMLLLCPGKWVLKVNTGFEGEWCGLIPVGKSCQVTTAGLKWNLDGGMLEFGTLVSTSNTYAQDNNGEVTLETNNPLLWCMGVGNVLP